jgi:citrate synthase
LTTVQAVAALGVSRQTLYAYTSRGLVRAVADPSDPRRSLYDPGDVRTLKERKARGRSRREVAASTINWGDPVLPSAITRIVDGKLLYRGHDAIDLSRTSTLEDVAALLWNSGPLSGPVASAEPASAAVTRVAGQPGQRCIEAIALMTGSGAWSVSPERALPDAVRLLQQIAAAAAGLNRYSEVTPVHELLARSWGKGRHVADLVRRALVLCADHELNASTYAARVIASTRASLGASVLGGLCALSGPLHGGATDAVRALLSDQSMVSTPEDALAARIAGGDRIPGFGHRLYPKGDPRAAELIAALSLAPRWRRVVDAAIRATGTWPNIDFALVLLEKQLRLPLGAAFGMFATGRVAGWIAHALEQWSEGKLIRPRAAYVGQ